MHATTIILLPILLVMTGISFAFDGEDLSHNDSAIKEFVELPAGRIPIEQFAQKASEDTGEIFAVIRVPKPSSPESSSRGVETMLSMRIRQMDASFFYRQLLYDNDYEVHEVHLGGRTIQAIEDMRRHGKAEYVPFDDLVSNPIWTCRTNMIWTAVRLERLDVSKTRTQTQLVTTREAGCITTIPEINGLIFADYAGTAFHIGRMLLLMDQDEESRGLHLRFETVQLENVGAEKLHGILLGMRTGCDSAYNDWNAMIAPDLRTNSLKIYAVEEDMQMIKQTVLELDKMERHKEFAPKMAVSIVLRQTRVRSGDVLEFEAEIASMTSEPLDCDVRMSLCDCIGHPAFHGPLKQKRATLQPYESIRKTSTIRVPALTTSQSYRLTLCVSDRGDGRIHDVAHGEFFVEGIFDDRTEESGDRSR